MSDETKDQERDDAGSTMSDAAVMFAELSQWIDDGQGGRDPEAITWGRLAKVSEENGEVIEAFIGATGQNPRKGFTHTRDDVRKELLDVAATALAAYEHMTDNRGRSMPALLAHIVMLHERAKPYRTPAVTNETRG